MTDTSKISSPMRRLKRSRVLHVSSLMATAGFTLAACGSPPQTAAAPEGDWVEPTASYSSVEACVASGEKAEDCQTAFKNASDQAEKTAPRFQSQQDCEQEFGAGQCQQGQGSNGTSFFMPMLAGFMMARMMNGAQGPSSPLYRDCRTRAPDGSCRGGFRTGASYLGRGSSYTQANDNSSQRTVARGGFGSRGGYGG